MEKQIQAVNKPTRQETIAAMVGLLDQRVFEYYQRASKFTQDAPRNARELIESTSSMQLLEERISNYICDIAKGNGFEIKGSINTRHLIDYIKSDKYSS